MLTGPKTPANDKIIKEYLEASENSRIDKMQEIEEQYELPIDIHFNAIVKNLAHAPTPIAQSYILSPPPNFTPFMKRQLLEAGYNKHIISKREKRRSFSCALL